MEHAVPAAMPTGDGSAESSSAQPDVRQYDAARLIQRNYRGYRTRRQMRGIGLDPQTRWIEAVKELQYRSRTRPISRHDPARASISSADAARRNWQRVGAVAMRAGGDDSSTEWDSGESDTSRLSEREARRARRAEAKEERRRNAKMMDLQYFLELVDSKHRYGSNLRAYHNEWRRADTTENFFYWLDEGEGRDIELPTVSRERLDSMRVRYLSREERRHYLVVVDKEGRLCWARNGERISTSTDFMDSPEGIVRRPPSASGAGGLRASFSSAITSSTASSGTISAGPHPGSAEDAQHYLNHDLTRAKGLHKLKHVSASVILNQLLQKSTRPNSWIFVADTSFRLYVGIKQSGAFQHSSFLHGARISAAGLIKIKDGQLRSLSPLSGHYRPPTRNFRLFVRALREEGVDMSRVSVSKSYAVLVGLEAYVKTRKKVKHGVERVVEIEERIVHPEEVRRRKEQQIDKSKSAEAERRILEAQEAERRKQGFGARVWGRLRGVRKEKGKERVGEIDRRVLSKSGEDAEGTIAPEGKR